MRRSQRRVAFECGLDEHLFLDVDVDVNGGSTSAYGKLNGQPWWFNDIALQPNVRPNVVFGADVNYFFNTDPISIWLTNPKTLDPKLPPVIKDPKEIYRK